MSTMLPTTARPPELDETTPLTVSLKTLALRLDAHRASVRRWLTQAGIRPLAMSDAKNGAIRYRWSDIERWLATREAVD